jgi:DNA primase
MDAGIPAVSRIKDRSLRDEYARRLAGLIGFGLEEQVLARVRGLERADDRRARPVDQRARDSEVDPTIAKVEREVLQVALQMPAVAGPEFDALNPEAFLVGAYQQIRRAIADAGGTAAGLTGPAWTEAVQGQLQDDRIRHGVQALAVDPLRSHPRTDEEYARYIVTRMLANVTERQIAAIKSSVQRINPQEQPDEHARVFGELIALESYHRGLRERVHGTS